MPAQINLKDAYLSRIHGDIAAIYTWIRVGQQYVDQDPDRALILVAHHRPGSPWFIVKDSVLHEWDDSTLEGTISAAKKAKLACEVLGIEPNKANIQRIAKIVIEGMLDLIRMPNKRPEILKGPSYGERKILVEGEVISAEEIKVAAPDGIEYA